MAHPTWTQVRLVRNDLLAVLREAAKERDQRPDRVETPEGPEMEWALHERRTMLAWVNQYRADHGLPDEITEAEVTRVERQAAGHIDYAEKFALYCADLAMREEQH